MYDLIVIGGGTSGVASCVMAKKAGVNKVLLVEKNSFLGGAQTASLVTPMMKNIDKADNINSSILDEVLAKLSKTGDCATHPNGNKGWFNPEMLKVVLDEICIENNIDVLFETSLISVEVDNHNIISIKLHNKQGIQLLKAKQYIDATGDADLAKLSGIECFEINEKEHQAVSLRFNMSGVDIEKLSSWLLSIDNNTDVTSSYCVGDNVLLTTAYTWDTNNWALKPYFDKAIKNGDLEKEDSAYFQIFSVAGQPSTITFNCPRIYLSKYIDVLDAQDRSKAYMQGRKQIVRIANFCKKYLIGFENAHISSIANDLGVRVSRIIKGDYQLTKDDIIGGKKFNNPVLNSNYPMDVHSNQKGESVLDDIEDYYQIPKDSLMSEKIQNLLVVGRSISADFIAQSSLRVQPNCWCMGEYAGKLISERLYNNEE